MNEVQSHRETAQPIREKTGGSTFKNPPGNSAWKLIDAAGCRGLRVGGAQVSEMHCNFLINTGNATGHDIETLGETVRERVKAEFWNRATLGNQADRNRARLMRITILFGGTNKERLVSVASAQALHRALPEADLWFWDVADTVHEVALAKPCSITRGRSRMNSNPATAASPLEAALDKAKAEDRVLVLGLHGGRAENGELQAMCELRGIAFTGSGSASSHLAFDKVAAKRFAAIAGVTAPAGIALEDLDAAFAEYGRLIAKPARDGSSYGLIFVNAKQDLVAVRNAARTEEYLIEPFVSGVEATCGVLEQSDGTADVAAADRDRPGGGRVRLHGKISAQIDSGDLPGPLFARDHGATDGPGAAGAPGAVLQRLFPDRLHRLGEGADLSRNQYPAGPDRGFALSEGAEGTGDRIRRFSARPDRAGRKAHPRTGLICRIRPLTGR